MANEYMKAGAVVTLVPESDGKLKFEKADVKDLELITLDGNKKVLYKWIFDRKATVCEIKTEANNYTLANGVICHCEDI